MTRDRQLDGRVALVTGASSGIGREAALAFARAGARVVLSDVHETAGEDAADQIRRAGGQAHFIRADVAVDDDVDALVTRAVETFGRLDCAFNNAGIEGALGPLETYPRDAWDRVIAVNLTGVWLCLRRELAVMQERGSGVIVNNASILGTVGFANASAYVAAKHGVIGLTRTAALEAAPAGIRVVAVCPGFIETPMVMDRGVKVATNRAAFEQLVSLHPLGRLGKSEEIADAVVWLCTDGAGFVTGHALLVDGGYTAR